MDRSTIQLKSGSVEEEKPRCKGTVQVGNGSFGYAEKGEGKEKRSIGIYVKGVADSWVLYTIDPDPHDIGRYKNEARQFYESLAKKLGESYVKNRKFPNEISVNVFRNEFVLTKSEDR